MRAYYQSFANRLTRKVMLATLTTLIVIASIIIGITLSAVKYLTDEKYESVMSMVNEKLERVLATEELCARNVIDEVFYWLDSPEKMMESMENEIKLNNYTEGYFIAFEPYHFPQYGRWFEIYMNKISDEHPRNIGSADHDYLSKEWYAKGKESKTGFWTDPYFDEIGMTDNVCSFVMALYDKRDSIVGVFGADLSLKWLAKELKIINAGSYHSGVFDNIDNKDYRFYTFIISRDGTFIAHPQWERVMKENVLSYIDQNDEHDMQVIADMKQGKAGKSSMVIDGLRANVYYTPLGSTNWSVAIVVPQRAFWLPALSLVGILLIITVIGMVVIYLFCRSNIRQVVSPLNALADSADEVAKGNFDAPLPDIRHKDEVCKLRDSFAAMQSSLEQYMQDLKEQTAKEAAFKYELNVAGGLQMSMIPNTFPERSDIDLYGYLKPAKSIGGDLYDYFIRDDKLFFCIGDVSGKGIPAALLMAATHYLFRITSGRENDPKRIVENVNDLLSEDNKALMFCTFFLGVLDLKTHLLKYCNAGHECPILITSEVNMIPVECNLALGLGEGFDYKSEEIQLSPGNVLLLYTDGLKEAANQELQPFEKQRIKDSLQQLVDNGQAKASEYVHHLVDDVSTFVKDAPQSDDLTLMAIVIKK
ncbi:MAG: SpoIIE family protein phosphatase [Prevotella sp.]|nr:SpoIIE family protein phosphatase [Prevotella sp.]